MSDLISRQAAIDLHCELCPDNDKCICEYCPDVEAFRLLPTAKPIIRCCDCEYYRNNYCYVGIDWKSYRKADDFCSFAERRSDG